MMKVGVIFACILLTVSAWAQFDKFKMSNKNSSESRSNSRKSTRGVDNFGRSSTQVKTESPEREKFVNLNPETAFGPEVIKNFNHPNTTLMDLTTFMQKLTGINFILGKEELREKVSIMAPSPITVGDAWKAYLTVLDMNGYSLVKSGAFYKIRKKSGKANVSGKIYTGSYVPSTANLVMKVIPLKHIDAKDFSSKIGRFLNARRGVVDLGNNTILLRDTGENINRIVRLIEFIDIPGHEETLQIIRVEHSSAQEIAGLLDQILSGQGQSRRGGRFRNRNARNNKSSKSESISRIIADPRTNTIIAMANADGARRLRTLIKKLDSKNVASGGGQIHVYYLNHGNAKALAATLEKLVSSSSANNRRRRNNSRNRSSFSGNIPEISLFNNTVKITADEDNNALVITAAPTDYETIKSVLKKLDIARDQVYVEGMMMETIVNKDKEVGTSLVGAYGTGAVQRFGVNLDGGTNNNLLQLLTTGITSLGGIFGGFQKGAREVNIGGQKVKIGSINGLIKAIVQNSNTNVLATPQILALDNTKATFEVSRSVPVRKETTGQGGFSSFSYSPQKVGLKLEITPRINKVTRFVRLEINQTIGDFSEQYQGGDGAGLATIERGTNTTVVVRDRDTIAMGGLMRDSDEISESKVPLLGDIPILGWLFRSKSSKVEKINLLMFMTPRILSNYQKDSAQNTRGLIERRKKHLEKVRKADSFEENAKEIFNKTIKQERGPLYNLEEGQKFLRENEEPGIGNPDEEEIDVPDYGKIIQTVKETRAGTVEK